MIQFIKSIIPSLHVLSNVSAEITIQLRSDSIEKFPAVFHGLDSKKEEFKIESYGISITTLEEVFLKVAENESQDKPVPLSINKEQKENESGNGEDEDSEIDNFDLNSVRIKNKAELFGTHFLALIKKRILYFKRDTRSFLCEVFLPFVVVVGGLALTLI